MSLLVAMLMSSGLITLNSIKCPLQQEHIHVLLLTSHSLPITPPTLNGTVLFITRRRFIPVLLDGVAGHILVVTIFVVILRMLKIILTLLPFILNSNPVSSFLFVYFF